MKDVDLNINFVFTAKDNKMIEKFEIYSNNIFQIYTFFLKLIGKQSLKIHTHNVINEENLSSIIQNNSLTMIFLSEELMALEDKIIELETELFPVILQDVKMEEYIEIFCNIPTYNLSEYTDTINEKKFTLNLSNFKIESLYNFIYQFSETWLKKLKNQNLNLNPKHKVLLGTVHPILLDFQLQVKMYLERVGCYVEIFYCSSSDIKIRKEEIRAKCKEFDAVIHLMNDYYKRYTNDDTSLMSEEIFEVFDYIEMENPSRFHSFCWIEPQIDETKNLNLNRMLEKIKLISAESKKVHSYQVTIEEFKNLISNRLDFFLENEDNLKKEDKQYLYIYATEDDDEAKIYFNKIQSFLPTLIDFSNLIKENRNFMNDFHFLCTYNTIFLFVNKVDNLWFENLVKSLLKVFGINNSRTKTKIKIIHSSSYENIDEFITFGCMSYHINESINIQALINE